MQKYALSLNKLVEHLRAGSDTNASLADFEGLVEGVVGVTSDEVLEQQLRVGEVAGVVLEALTMGAHQSLLEIGRVPDPLLHFSAVQQVLALLNQLVGSHLHVLVKEIAAEDLLPVLVVNIVRGDEEQREGSLGNELEVLIVEEHIVVIEEEE